MVGNWILALTSVANAAVGTTEIVGWGSSFRYEQASVQGQFLGVDAGVNFTVAIRADGSPIAWGGATYRETKVPPIADCSAVAAGLQHTLVIWNKWEQGQVVGWGDNTYGKCLGTRANGAPDEGSAIGQPTTIDGVELRGVKQVAASSDNSVAILSSGSVVGWGWLLHHCADDAHGCQVRLWGT